MKDRMPLGLKIILACEILFIVYSLSYLNTPISLLSSLLSGNLAFVAHIVFLIADIAWIISLVKRYKWGWKLYLANTFFSTTSAIIGMIVSPSIHYLMRSIYLYLVLGVIIFASYYVYSKRSYFNR